VAIDAESSTDMAIGRLRAMRVSLGRARRLFRLREATLTCESLDLGLLPAALVATPVLLLLRPSLFLPLVLLLFLAPRQSSQGRGGGGTTFRLAVAASDLNSCGLWRFLLSAALRSIMENSVAGLVALPREVSGQLSEATSFELGSVGISERRLVVDARAKLPDGTLFDYRLRFGVTLVDVEGSKCIFWEDPEVKVVPGWPLPDFWAPIGGFAATRLPGSIQLSRTEITGSGALVVEGGLGRSRSLVRRRGSP